MAEIFADDVAALMKRLQDAEEIAEDFMNFLADFKCTVHVGTKENAKSKSVVLFAPANEEERARHSGKPLSLSGGRTTPCAEVCGREHHSQIKLPILAGDLRSRHGE